MIEGRPKIQNSSIALQISSRVRKLLIVSGCLQMLAILAVTGFISINDATRRSRFLSESNEKSLGLMLSTGDLFQLESTISSFQNEDTPEVSLMHRDNETELFSSVKTGHLRSHSKDKIQLIHGNVFLSTEYPISYNGQIFGKIRFLNKVRMIDWIILIPVLLLITITFSFFQGKSLEKFSLSLASAISGLGKFFDHVKSEESILTYARSRQSTIFPEVETVASQIHNLLGELLRANEIEKESEKYKAVAKVTAHVAHDLRHPLSVFEAVSKASDWSAFNLVKPELSKSLARIENMIDGLRNTDTSRLVSLSPNRLTLGEIVAETLPIAREKGTIIRCEGNFIEIHCMMDLSKLTRALHNLIFNAIEAGANEVILRCNSTTTDYLLEVIDNGPGVPEDFVARLFVEGATFGKVGGTGLGLSSVQSTISSHRGSISYRRNANSTIFSIKLPMMFDGSDEGKEFPRGTSIPVSIEQNDQPRVLVQLNERSLELDVVEQLSKSGIEMIEDTNLLRKNDIIYTDDDDLVLLSMTKYRAMTMRHSGISTASEIAKNVSFKYHLKLHAIGKTNGES